MRKNEKRKEEATYLDILTANAAARGIDATTGATDRATRAQLLAEEDEAPPPLPFMRPGCLSAEDEAARPDAATGASRNSEATTGASKAADTSTGASKKNDATTGASAMPDASTSASQIGDAETGASKNDDGGKAPANDGKHTAFGTFRREGDDASTGATPGVASACKDLGMGNSFEYAASRGIKPPGQA